MSMRLSLMLPASVLSLFFLVQPSKAEPQFDTSVTAQQPGASTQASLGTYDRHSEWTWQPVKIGAGGFMRGLVIHPLNVNVRYARSDTWGAYRWDASKSKWVHMVTAGSISSNTTIASSTNPSETFKLTATPNSGSVDSVAIDPQITSRVYLAMTISPPGDITNDTVRAGNVYYSTDQGVRFSPSKGLILPSNTNPHCQADELEGQNTAGERLRVDPTNSNVVYLGSALNGVFVSADAARNFKPVVGGGVPGACQSVLNVLFDPTSTISRTINGTTQVVSKNIYLVVDGVSDSGTSQEKITTGVFRSTDGGVNWTNISAGRTELIHQSIGGSVLDSKGAFLITSGDKVLKYSGGVWVVFQPPNAGSNIAIDPTNDKRIFVSKYNVSLSRSLDGGQTWTDLGSPLSVKSTETINWINARPLGGVILASLLFDGSGGTAGGKGRLWVSSGNDGILYADLDDTVQTSPSTGLNWLEQSKGIEQLVGQNIVIPPGGSNAAVVTAEDEAVFYVSNPNKFSAIHYDVDLFSKGNNGLGTNGMVAYSPDTPSVMVTNPANLFASGYRGGPFRNNFAGYSINYGRNWQFMPSIKLTDGDNSYGTGSITNNPENLVGGQIAISARGTKFPGKGQPIWTGQDNIVWLSFGSNDSAFGATNVPPRYSFDGGASWQDGTVFDENGNPVDFANNQGLQFIFVYSSKQFALVADPITPSTFYALTVGAFMVTKDGGKTWRIPPKGASTAFQPALNFFINAKLIAVPGKSGDLWLSTGSGSPVAGGYLFHSIDGGNNWKQLPVTKAYSVALGKGALGSSYALYIYGTPVSGQPYGVYRSDDLGVTWFLISGNGINGYPVNSFNLVSDIAASQDTEGLVYMSVGGMGYLWGYQKSVGSPYPQ
jgi:hypothetical protein